MFDTRLLVNSHDLLSSVLISHKSLLVISYHQDNQLNQFVTNYWKFP